jgi:hypothetical protein
LWAKGFLLETSRTSLGQGLTVCWLARWLLVVLHWMKNDTWKQKRENDGLIRLYSRPWSCSSSIAFQKEVQVISSVIRDHNIIIISSAFDHDTPIIHHYRELQLAAWLKVILLHHQDGSRIYLV